MSKVVAWAVFAVGVAHIVFGLVRFKAPLAEALAAGFIDQFRHSEARQAAFWFLMCGPLLMLVGHMAVRAVAAGDQAVLRIIGSYALAAAVVGIAAFPKSPLWSLLVLAIALIAAA
jgi:uncharacterized protein DUF6463